MSLYPNHYNSPAIKKVTSPAHLNHCLDMVRQTIQCFADVTPMPARLGDNESGLLISYRSDTEHMCHDFEKVKEWASARRGSEEFVRVLMMPS
jgi:hypothetical protein